VTGPNNVLCFPACFLTGWWPSNYCRFSTQGLTPIHQLYLRIKVKVILRPTVSRPVRLGVRHPSGTSDQFFSFLEICFRQLRVWYFVAPSLTRGRVCNLLLLLVLASAVPLGSGSRGTQDYIILSQFKRLPQPGVPGPRIYIPQEQGGPVIPPGTGFPFRHLLQLAGLRWRYSIPPPHGNPSTSTNYISLIVLPIISMHGQHRKYRSSIVVCRHIPSNGRSPVA
jgi:hypothetical protein